MWTQTCASTAKYNSRFAASCGSAAQYFLLSQLLLHPRKAANLSLSRRVFGGYLIARVRHSNTPKTRSVARKYPSEFYVRVTVHRNKFLRNKTNQMYQFPKFTPAWNSTCFGKFLCPSSVYLLYTRHWYVSYRFVDSFRASSKVVFKPVWHIPMPSVQ